MICLSNISKMWNECGLDCQATVGLHKEKQSSRSQQQKENNLQWRAACGVWDWLYWYVQDEQVAS